MDDRPDELHPRIEKLEDAHAFTERHSEKLSDELRLAFDRISRLEKRLLSLDERLVQLSEAIDEGERTLEDDVPPHSGKR